MSDKDQMIRAMEGGYAAPEDFAAPPCERADFDIHWCVTHFAVFGEEEQACRIEKGRPRRTRALGEDRTHCWHRGTQGAPDCDRTDVSVDPESGPLRALLCPTHMAEMMRRRDENEASYFRALEG